MIVINPDDTVHQLVFIPRYDIESVTLILRNKETNETETTTQSTTYANGYMTISLTKTVLETQSYEMEVRDDETVLFRDKIFCTDQTDLENYQVNPDIIRY